jgi:hypothetical protein
MAAEPIDDDEPIKEKKPSGALQLKEGDLICNRCAIRKANAMCSLGRCLKCCSVSTRACSYRGHAPGRKPVPTFTYRALARAPVTVAAPKSTVNRDHANVRIFLENLHLEQYYPLFVTNGFESPVSLGSLDEEILTKLGIKLMGHRALLLSAASQLSIVPKQ